MFKKILALCRNKKYDTSLDRGISLFEMNSKLKIPSDLAEYFKMKNEWEEELSKDLFEFYPFDQFKSIDKGLAHWGGIPDYRNIVNKLERCENCFVFADYMAHLFAYAIRLHPDANSVNEVYMICGDTYKVLAYSFSDFLRLYFEDSWELKNI